MRLAGDGFFDDTKVVFVTITPDANLKQFRHQLSQALLPVLLLTEI